MSRKGVFLFVLIGLFFATNAVAGPFGLEMGMSLRDIGGEPERVDLGCYRLSHVPEPHQPFNRYDVTIGPKSGLCQIDAWCAEPMDIGVELKSAFKEIEKKLEAFYGKHETMEYLFRGAMKESPAAIWETKEGSSLPGGLKTIYLGTFQDPGSLSPPSGAIGKAFIVISYEFTNIDSCMKELAEESVGLEDVVRALTKEKDDQER
jgi:hypothetical protein